MFSILRRPRHCRAGIKRGNGIRDGIAEAESANKDKTRNPEAKSANGDKTRNSKAESGNGDKTRN